MTGILRHRLRKGDVLPGFDHDLAVIDMGVFGFGAGRLSNCYDGSNADLTGRESQGVNRLLEIVRLTGMGASAQAAKNQDVASGRDGGTGVYVADNDEVTRMVLVLPGAQRVADYERRVKAPRERYRLGAFGLSHHAAQSDRRKAIEDGRDFGKEAGRQGKISDPELDRRPGEKGLPQSQGRDQIGDEAGLFGKSGGHETKPALGIPFEFHAIPLFLTVSPKVAITSSASGQIPAISAKMRASEILAPGEGSRPVRHEYERGRG